MHIGIAGIGRMGSNMGLRLLESGNTLTVWNRTADKLEPLTDAGAKAATTPAELASGVDVIITIVTNAAAIDAAVQVALAEKVRAKGATYVECPVGGSTAPARQGKLLGMIGGEPADAARAKPILDQLCRRTLRAGPVGSGAVLKLTVNLPLMIYWQALGEALALSGPLKIDPAELVDFLSDTSAGPNVLKQRAPAIVASLKGVKADSVTFNLDGGIKDVKAMLDQARHTGIELPLVARTLDCYEEAKRNTSGEEEVSSVSTYWAHRGKQ
jgi:3-hydroxyisobutyrate dehydrogenase